MTIKKIMITVICFWMIGNLNAQRVIDHAKDNAKMVLIPAGEYEIGSPNGVGDLDEHPLHAVKLDAFYIDQFEVTNAQFAKFIAATGRSNPKFWDDPNFNQPDQPVVGVTFEDATFYAIWAEKRLPTEAEWEAAAHGRISQQFPWGDLFDLEIDGVKIHANISGSEDGFDQIAPIGSFPSGASPFGVHDMAGNAMEWISDFYHDQFYQFSLIENPENIYQSAGRVLRGGSWKNPSHKVRSTKRGVGPTFLASDQIGFRCAMTADENVGTNETPWDVDQNGAVDIFDLVLVAKHFGDQNAIIGDVNGDNRVDIFDLVQVASHFGEQIGN